MFPDAAVQDLLADRHRDEYYVEDVPTMSEGELDELLKEFVLLEYGLSL